MEQHSLPVLSKVRQSSDNQGIYARRQSRLYNRCKERAMVDGNSMALATLGLLVKHGSVMPAKEPETIRLIDIGAQDPKILAAQHILNCRIMVLAEMFRERLVDNPRSLGIVDGQRKRRSRLDGGLLGRVSRHSFSLDDAAHRSKNFLAPLGTHGADVDFDDGLVGDDVFGAPGLEGADGDDGGLVRWDLPRHDGLQAHDDVARDHDRVDRHVRHRPVPAAAVDGDLEAVCCGHQGSRLQARLARLQGEDVLSEHHVRDRACVLRGVVEPVVDHRLGAAASFLCRLEEENDRAGPFRLCCDERLRRCEERCDVEVMAAGVHDWLDHAVDIELCLLACVG